MAHVVESTELGELLRLLAHDLRNPLSALDSNLTFLEAELDGASEHARESLDDLRLSCDGLARLVDSVEVLGRFLQGRAAEEKAPTSIATLTRSALELVRPAARSHWVELAPSGECFASDIEVVVGRDMFVRALRAILQNSIQHAPQGSQVKLSLRTAPESVVLRVQDSGARLDADMLDVAFTAAGQLRAKRSGGGRYSGGLGLFCARICADAAGARLGVVEGAAVHTFELAVPRV